MTKVLITGAGGYIGSNVAEYFVQHGNNVYRVWNNGKSGFLTTRNEECEAAFEAFVNSISFK